MPKNHIQNINDTNYSITDKNGPVKKKRHVVGTILALIFSLLLALFMRYYIEKNSIKTPDNEVTTQMQDDGNNA
jgi:hypothetical protein